MTSPRSVLSQVGRAMIRTRSPWSSEGGFTVVEMLVATAAIGLVLAGLAGFLSAGQQSFLTGANQIEAQQNIRIAIARMMEEVRNAGNGPSGAGFTAIAAGQTATSVTLQNDWDGNGAINPAITVTVNGVLRGEQVTYTFANNQLTRRESAVDADAVPLVGGVQTLAFTYLDAAGAVTAVTADIRSVLVTVQTSPATRQAYASPQGQVFVSMTDSARIRNR